MQTVKDFTSVKNVDEISSMNPIELIEKDKFKSKYRKRCNFYRLTLKPV